MTCDQVGAKEIMASNVQTVVCVACSSRVRLEDRWWHTVVCPMAMPAAYVEISQQQLSRCLDCRSEMPETELEMHVCLGWVPDVPDVEMAGGDSTPTVDEPSSPPRHWIPWVATGDLPPEHDYAR